MRTFSLDLVENILIILHGEGVIQDEEMDCMIGSILDAKVDLEEFRAIREILLQDPELYSKISKQSSDSERYREAGKRYSDWSSAYMEKYCLKQEDLDRILNGGDGGR